MYVLSLNDSFPRWELKWSITDSRIDYTQKILLGDYNGDGKMDVMFSTGYNSLFATFMSTGKGFVKHEQYQPFSNVQNTWDGVNTMQQHVLMPSDVNGDGKTDIIYARTTTYNSTDTGSIYTVVHHNTGVNSSSYAPLFGASASTTKTTNVRHNPIPLFLNPDRQNPEMEYGFVSDNTVTLFKSHKNMQREALLTTIEQDGVTYEVEYAQLMPDDYYVYDIPLYESSYDQTYPYIDIYYAPNTRVVPRITRTAVSQTVQQVFGYREAVSNAEGLGFVGFRELIRSNWHVDMLDSNRTFTIGVQSPQLRGANLRTFTSKWSYITDSIRNMALTVPPPIGGVPDGATLQWDYITRQDVAYYTDTLANRTFVNISIATSTKDLLSGTYHNRQMQYDSLYNVTYLTEDINNEASKRTGMTYANSTGTPYYVGRLLSQQDTVMLATDTTTAETQYTYTDYLPTEIKRKGHGTDFVIDSLTYDTFGNVTERKMTVPGGAQRTETMQYDASGRFMTQHMDPDSLTTMYSYYTGIGQPQTVTDPYGRTETYTYDTFSRLVSTTDYLSNTYTKTLSRSGTSTHVTDLSPDGAESCAVFNALGQKTEERSKTVLGIWVGKAWRYDAYGRQYMASQPYASSPSQWDTICYDKYGRINQEHSYTGKIKTYSYNGLVTVGNDGIKAVTTTRNAVGQVVSVQDPGGTVTYSYYANGNLKETDYGGSVQTIEQDGWGRKTKLTDPSAGVYTYSYDGWGQIVEETTPKGTATYGYDGVGKVLSKSLVGDSTDMQWTYSYDPVHKLPVQTVLLNADGNDATYAYTYDTWRRPESVTEDNAHATFGRRYTYDGFGRTDSIHVEGGEKATGRQAGQGWKHHYQNGEMLKVTLDGTGTVLWKVDSLDGKGLMTRMSQGTNQFTRISYDSYGYLSGQQLIRSSTSTVLMDLRTTFDASKGFPIGRSNSVFAWVESFDYDSMDRLTTFNDNDGSHSQQYDARGRITENSLQGQYNYLGNSYQQHELELNPTAGLYYQSRSPQQISFNAFKKPVEIHETGHDRISFQYNGALQRAHSYYGSEDADPLDRPYRRHYSEDGSVEITRDMLTNTTGFVFYLGGDAYSAPAIWKVEQNSTSLDAQLYYLHRDYLGSILMITDSVGTVMEQRQFDAWGNIVKLTDGSSTPLDKFVILDRGYTGHEHLFGVALINMNGRLYDARLHRFLSPDNFVQDPFGTQSFNRYGYALNNPLVYVDQNGEFFVIDSWLIGLFSGGWEEANKRAANDIKIWGGLFVSDSNKSLGGRVWEIFSRLTWQLPQTLGGLLTAHSYNTFGIKEGVESVDYKFGATVVRTRDGGWGGVTQGSFIVGDNSIRADANNPLFQHEYGHYLQSQKFGWFYYNKIGIPSILSMGKHNLHPAEQDANVRAYNYFTNRYKDDSSYDFKWDYRINPIIDPNYQIRLSWWDYATLGFIPGNGINVVPNVYIFNVLNLINTFKH